MNNLVVFFIIIVDIPFHIIVSNGCHTTGKYDAITLSEKSREVIKEKLNHEDVALEMKKRNYSIFEDVVLETKKRYYRFFEEKLEFSEKKLEFSEKKLENYHMQSFYSHFTCAISTAKSVISDAMERHGIFDYKKLTRNEEKTYNKLKLPSNLYTLIVEQRDGKRPPDKTMDQHLSLILKRFRKFFFNLKKYGKSHLFVRLRALLNPGNKLNGAELDKVYTMFSATIVRDYSFFCAEHHSSIAKLLSDVNPPSSQHVIDSLMKENVWWYYDRVHIQNMNIFFKAYYNNDQFPEIEGFPCKNGVGEDVEIPLFNKCGWEPKYTLKPVIL